MDAWNSSDEENAGALAFAQLYYEATAGAEAPTERDTSPEYVPSSSEERHVRGVPRRELWCRPRIGGLRSKPSAAVAPRREVFSAQQKRRQREPWAAASATVHDTTAAAPDATAGATAGAVVDPDGEEEAAVGLSGLAAGGSADAPAPPPGPYGPGSTHPQRGRWWWYNRTRATGPYSGGHGCPQSADPRVTEGNRRKKERKAAAQQRWQARLENMDEDAKRKDAWDRTYDRCYREQLVQFREAHRQRTAGEASESPSY